MAVLPKFDERCRIFFGQGNVYISLPKEDGTSEFLTIPLHYWERLLSALDERWYTFSEFGRWWLLGVAYGVLVQEGTEAEQATVRTILEQEIPTAWDAFTEMGMEFVMRWISPKKWYATVWLELKAELNL